MKYNMVKVFIYDSVVLTVAVSNRGDIQAKCENGEPCHIVYLQIQFTSQAYEGREMHDGIILEFIAF